MLMFIILFVTHLFVVGIARFTFGLYAKPNKNVVLETTLADQYIQREEVQGTTRDYLKQLNRLCFVLALLGLPLVVIPYDSLSMIYFIVLLILSLGALQYTLIINISKMQHLKITNDWFTGEKNTRNVRVDTSLSLQKNRQALSLWWFLPPILMTLGQYGYCFILAPDALLFAHISLVILVISGLMYYSVLRLPAKVFSPDTEVNHYCNDLTKRSWSSLALIITYFIFTIQGLMALSLFKPNFSLTLISWLFVLATFAFIGVTGYVLIRSRQKQNAALNQVEKYYYEEVDEAWKYGIYINPHDPSLMVQDRIGMNISLNFGHKSAKGLTIGMGAVITLILGFTFMMMLRVDFTNNAFLMDLGAQEVTLSAPLAKTSQLPYSDIQGVELLTEVPKSTRVNGMGTANYATGKFKVQGEKDYAEFYVDHRSAVFIKITTTNKNYYFSQAETSQTEQTYEELLKKVN